MNRVIKLRSYDKPVPEGFDPWTADVDPHFGRVDVGSEAYEKWWHAQQVIAMKAQISDGDGVAAAIALRTVLQYRIPVPAWLADSVVTPLERFERFEVRGLDAAFGLEPLTENQRLRELRRETLRAQIHVALVDALDSNLLRPIDNFLFEEVGAQFHIGKTKCRELYEEAVDRGMEDLKSVRRLLKIFAKRPAKQG